MASSLLQTTNRMMLLGRVDRHMHEWSLIPVGGTGRVVSTPNRRVDQCSGSTNLPWLLPGPVLWAVPQEALIGLDPEYTLSTLKTTLAKVWQPRPSRLEYLRRRCLLRRRQASFISPSIIGVTFDQDAGRVDSAPGRLLSLALRSGLRDCNCYRAERTGTHGGASGLHSQQETHTTYPPQQSILAAFRICSLDNPLQRRRESRLRSRPVTELCIVSRDCHCCPTKWTGLYDGAGAPRLI